MDCHVYRTYSEETKAKRNRESNWNRNEKKALIRIVQRYKTTVDNKRNDSVWIRRKNAAWDAIQRAMYMEGHRRGVKSVRQQWTRMKGEARKQSRRKKEECDSDDNSQAIHQPQNTDPLDCVIKEEDDLFQPQDTDGLDFNDHENQKMITPSDDNLLCVESILNSMPSPEIDSSGITSGTGSSTNGCGFDPPLPLNQPGDGQFDTHYPGASRSVLHARLRQIDEETRQKAEIHSIEVNQRHEIHALRVRQMRDQIEQQRRLFEAQLQKMKSST